MNTILKLEPGLDLTDILGIVKYEAPIPACLSGKVKGSFPSFIPRTDEERIQNLTDRFEDFKSIEFYVTEKLDGASATYYLNNGEFGVCSRNLDLLEDDSNSLWRVARKLDIENGLRSLGKNIAIQGELIGEGVQGNPYKIKGQDFRLFNVFDIDAYSYSSWNELSEVASKLKITTVPLLDNDHKISLNIDELLKSAEGKSVLNSSQEREGLVFRSLNGGNNKISFKIISNSFLAKEK